MLTNPNKELYLNRERDYGFSMYNLAQSRVETTNRCFSHTRNVPFYLEDRMPIGVYVRTEKHSLNAGKLGFTCKVCGKRFYIAKSIIKHDSKRGINAGKFCSRECFYKSPERSPNGGKFGEESYGWRGGIINTYGYKLSYVKNHPFARKVGGNRLYVLEHRLIMEKHLRRYLLPSELVHHRNGDKADNRIENLELVDKNTHAKYHLIKLWNKIHTCPKCGFEFKDKCK